MNVAQVQPAQNPVNPIDLFNQENPGFLIQEAGVLF